MYLKTLSSSAVDLSKETKNLLNVVMNCAVTIPGKGKEDKTGGQNFGFCESFYTYSVMK